MITVQSLSGWPPFSPARPRTGTGSHHGFCRTRTHFSHSLFCSKLPFPISPKTTPILCRSSSNDPKESAFFDENGVVQDMDGYLNYLSLEYDSVWDTKPSWCQPWTITLTGVLIISASWLLLHSAIVTAAVLTLVCAWWYIFLYSYPKAYSDMIAERRTKVTSGIEDTYGLDKNQ